MACRGPACEASQGERMHEFSDVRILAGSRRTRVRRRRIIATQFEIVPHRWLAILGDVDSELECGDPEFRRFSADAQ